MKKSNVMTKIIFNLIFAFIIISDSSFAETTEQIYYPYPIIFVHGLGGEISGWDYAKRQLDKYFRDQNGCKYPFQISQISYFPYCDYSAYGAGDIPTIATHFLRPSINFALNSFPADVPENEQKVIIVAHSMGGLVVRSLLSQCPDYQNKIERVVFVGTPHIGSPWADSVWILNNIRNDVVTPAINNYSVFYSQNAGSRFNFSDTSSSLQTTGAPSQINSYLLVALESERNILNSALSYADGRGFSGSPAIEQQRLNNDVSFHKTIAETIGTYKSSVELAGSTVGSETFLGNASENLDEPDNFKIVRGIDPNPILARIGDFLFTRIYTLYNNNFNFPPNLSLDDLYDTGDGIVNRVSQEGIGPADFTLSAYHVSARPFFIGEYEYPGNPPNVLGIPQVILLSIENKPLIERVKAVALDESLRASEMEYYIVVKVKDYLLADIEIEEMTINNNTIPDLNGFRDGENKYKPYFKFGKEFLKSREGPEVTDILGNKTKLKLEPGEFFVEATLSPGVNTLDLKVKNPAEEFAQDDTFTDEVEVYLSRPIIRDLLFVNGDGISGNGSWSVDVPPLDEDLYGDDYFKNFGTLTQFTITDEALTAASSENINVSASLYINTPEGLVINNPLKVLEEGTQVTLSLSSGSYSQTVTDFTTWDGTNESGNHVLGWDSSGVLYSILLLAVPISEDPYIYPHSDPPITKQLLIGTNWDTSNFDLISADPTFIQHSKELGIDFFSDSIQSRLKQRADRYRLSQRQTFEGFNYELASCLKELGAEKEVIAELESPTHPHKQNLTSLSSIIP